MSIVLIVCDDPTLQTGLARVGANVAEALRHDYEIVYHALHNSGLHADFPYRVVKDDSQSFGHELLPHLVKELKPEIVITIGDVFHFNYIPNMPGRDRFVWFLYPTIDSSNYAAGLPSNWQLALSNADYLATPSAYAIDQINSFLGTNPRYIPYGVSDGFFRYTEEECDSLRAKLGLQDYFVLIVVNRNNFRKQIPSALKLMYDISSDGLANDYYRGVRLYLHCNGRDMYGFDLAQLIDDYDIRSSVKYDENAFLNPTRMPIVSDDSLRDIYNLAAYGKGAHLITSGGEGFGLTILEGLRCGAAAIGNRCTSITEVVGDGGIVNAPIAYVTVEQGTEHAVMDLDAAKDSVRALMSDTEYARALSDKAISHAENYPWSSCHNSLRTFVSGMASRKPVYVRSKIVTHDHAVTLITEKGSQYGESTYYPISDAIELDTWDTQSVNAAISAVSTKYVVLLSHSTYPQRGWISEAVKLIRNDVAAISSTCINSSGRVIDGEVRISDEVVYAINEGAKPGNIDIEAFAFPFSAVLIDKDHLTEMGGLSNAFSVELAGIDFCLKCAEAGLVCCISSKSMVLKKSSGMNFDNEMMLRFRNANATFLKEPVEVTYDGPRAALSTSYGFIKKGEVVKIPRHQAIEAVTKYSHVSYKAQVEHNKTLQGVVNEGGRVKIARNHGFGDVISALLFGAYPLKKRNSDIHLTFVCDAPFTKFIQTTGLADDVQDYPRGIATNTGYSYVQDLCYVPESKDQMSTRPRPEVFAEHLGHYRDFEYEAYKPPEEYMEHARKLLREKTQLEEGTMTIGIQVTCTSQVRVYPPKYLGALAGLLIDMGFNVLLFGIDNRWHLGMENWNGPKLASFVNSTHDIIQTAAVMRYCDYFIAPDSGLMHLAAFMKIPTLALFGNIDPINRIKYYPTVKAIYPKGEVPCIPCGDIYNPCPNCPNDFTKGEFSGLCMRLLYPERVVEFFRKEILEEEIHDTIQINVDREEHTSCPICECIHFEEVNRIDFWDGEPIAPATYVKCTDCGVVFANPPFESVVYEQGYFVSGQEDRFYENILASDNTHNAHKVSSVFEHVRAKQVSAVRSAK